MWIIDRFFETSVELDLTVVTCETIAEDPNHSLPLDTTKLRQRAIHKGHPIFIMGCQMQMPDDIVIMEGYVTGNMAGHGHRDAFLCFQTVGNGIWMPGTAGFDEFGSFSFIVTRPRAKLQGAVHNPLFEFGNEKIGIKRLISGHLSAYKANQLATHLPAIKEWLVAMIKLDRNAIFEGSLKLWRTEQATRRPASQGDALFWQKSFTPRSSELTTDNDPFSKKLCNSGKGTITKAEDKRPSCGNHQPTMPSFEMETKTMAPSSCGKERVAEKASGSPLAKTHSSCALHPEITEPQKECGVFSLQTKARTAMPSSCVEMRLAEKAIEPALVEICRSSVHQADIELWKRSMSRIECPTQSNPFSALAKQKGLKRLAAKASNY